MIVKERSNAIFTSSSFIDTSILSRLTSFLIIKETSLSAFQACSIITIGIAIVILDNATIIVNGEAWLALSAFVS